MNSGTQVARIDDNFCEEHAEPAFSFARPNSPIWATKVPQDSTDIVLADISHHPVLGDLVGDGRELFVEGLFLLGEFD